MGLQLRDTSVKLWVDLLFSIQENFIRFKTKSLYHKDLFKLWQHPFYQTFVNDSTAKAQREIEMHVVRKNRIFLSPTNLDLKHSVLEKMMHLISTPWNGDYRKALNVMRLLNQLIYANLKEENEFEKAILKSFEKAVMSFHNTIQDELPEMGIRIFKQLFQQHWGKHRIAYEGTPTEGLQMMGLLETRLLDFKYIICLGLNEGSMPPNNPIQTLIPMDLRLGFGMPTTRDKQGLFAHHFYRLLHKVEKMTITHSTLGEELHAEPSRYIQQLTLEWGRLAKNVKIEQKTYSLAASPVKIQLDEVQKSPEIFAKLDSILASSVSASALNKYLTCPLDFYYRYILEYGDEDEVEEEMNNSTLGTIIHNVLEDLYEPFAHFDSDGNPKENAKMLLPIDITRMEGEYEKLIHEGFKAHYDNDEKSFLIGKNYLSYEMAISLTKQFLRKEKEMLLRKEKPLMIHSLERKLEAEITLEIHGQKKVINLKGFIDRIDAFDDKMRIVDYKSGKVKQEDLNTKLTKVADSDYLFGKVAKDNKTYFLQLWIYAYLFKQSFGYLPSEVTIISFVNYPDAPLSLFTGDMSLEDFVDELPTVLTQILEEMYSDEPFVHNPREKYMTYCDYCG
jgi:ATP-dependent helicase/nuclease subunit B